MHSLGTGAIQLDDDNGPIGYSSGFTATSFFLPIVVPLAAIYLSTVTFPKQVAISSHLSIRVKKAPKPVLVNRRPADRRPLLFHGTCCASSLLLSGQSRANHRGVIKL